MSEPQPMLRGMLRGLHPGLDLPSSRPASQPTRYHNKRLLFTVSVELGGRALADGRTVRQLVESLAAAVAPVVRRRRTARTRVELQLDLVDRLVEDVEVDDHD